MGSDTPDESKPWSAYRLRQQAAQVLRQQLRRRFPLLAALLLLVFVSCARQAQIQRDTPRGTWPRPRLPREPDAGSIPHGRQRHSGSRDSHPPRKLTPAVRQPRRHEAQLLGDNAPDEGGAGGSAVDFLGADGGGAEGAEHREYDAQHSGNVISSGIFVSLRSGGALSGEAQLEEDGEGGDAGEADEGSGVGGGGQGEADEVNPEEEKIGGEEEEGELVAQGGGGGEEEEEEEEEELGGHEERVAGGKQEEPEHHGEEGEEEVEEVEEVEEGEEEEVGAHEDGLNGGEQQQELGGHGGAGEEEEESGGKEEEAGRRENDEGRVDAGQGGQEAEERAAGEEEVLQPQQRAQAGSGVPPVHGIRPEEGGVEPLAAAAARDEPPVAGGEVAGGWERDEAMEEPRPGVGGGWQEDAGRAVASRGEGEGREDEDREESDDIEEVEARRGQAGGARPGGARPWEAGGNVRRRGGRQPGDEHSALSLGKARLRELIEAQQRGGLVGAAGKPARQRSGGGVASPRLRIVSGGRGAAEAKKPPAVGRRAGRPAEGKPGGRQGSRRSPPAGGYLYQDEESLTDEERAALRAERQRAAQEHAEFEAHKKGILKLRADRARAQRIRDAERRRAASGRDSFEFLS
eukprot:jgi/Tetstr1/443266/TSEL_031300.t1